MLEKGCSEEQIRESYQAELLEFKKTRRKYLLYPDFEQHKNYNIPVNFYEFEYSCSNKRIFNIKSN